LTPNPRIDLSVAIPLAQPLSMFVEPTNVCNFACPICPESFDDYEKKAGYYGQMSEQVWHQFMGNVLAWGFRLKVLRMYFEGEPLLNPKLPQMIADVSRFGLADRTEITTNGSRLNERTSRQLLESGLSYIRISVYGTDNRGYELATGSACTLDNILRNARELRQMRDRCLSRLDIHAQLVSDTADQDLFFKQWAPIADQCDVKQMHNWGSADSRLVQLGQGTEAPKVCSRLFYELALHANGDVSTCCVDWNRKLVIGSILKESLRDIWQGEALAKIQGMHLAGRRGEIPSCASCTIPAQQKDNIDHLVRTETVNA
jgi:radical SAM protein with 4Fe4S-binding SPASM domain